MFFLDFLWRTKLSSEEEGVDTMRGINKILLENILPAHVAEHYLLQVNKNSVFVFTEKNRKNQMPNFVSPFFQVRGAGAAGAARAMAAAAAAASGRGSGGSGGGGGGGGGGGPGSGEMVRDETLKLMC